jgi:hypothetical protein
MGFLEWDISFCYLGTYWDLDEYIGCLLVETPLYGNPHQASRCR